MLNKKIKFAIALAAAALLVSSSAWASVDRLGADLTPMGGEKAGNADGTIPAWDGGITKVPADYKGDGTVRTNPFAADKPLFSINAANLAQHEDKLTKGVAALLKKYPNQKIDVYQTRRSASAPQWYYDRTKANFGKAKLTADGLGVIPNGVSASVPFPIPETPQEVMFNFLLRWRGVGLEGPTRTVVVQPNGNVSKGATNYYEQYPWNNRDITIEGKDPYYKILAEYLEPARRKGEYALVIDQINASEHPRKAWQYLPGQRRVRRAPAIAFDTPNPSSSGINNYDDVFIFNGSMERYNWKLVGKKELYLPYNNYAFDLLTREEQDTVNFPGSGKTRFELHRFWVIEATLKEGSRHALAKREFYIDEDSWVLLAQDGYDNQGNLWKVALGHGINAYDLPGFVQTNYMHFDLTREDYVKTTYGDGYGAYPINKAMEDKLFTPEHVRRIGRR